VTSPGILITIKIEQDSKYALPSAPATVPQEVDARGRARQEAAQSVQVSKMTERSSQCQENNLNSQ